jgi:hypothetical protein
MTRRAKQLLGRTMGVALSMLFNTVVVEGSRREDGGRMTNVDVVRVSLDGEAQGQGQTMREVHEVGTNLVRVLSRPSGKRVLEGSPIRCVFNLVRELSEEAGDQRRGNGDSHG